MERRQIQRLAAADITPELFRDLAAHGEDRLVERKAQIPSPERLGAEVASMANMLGGWLLLGVDDKTHDLIALELPAGIDLQSHIGQRLRNAIDPVPPFLAGTLAIDSTTVGYVRVFRAAVPVLVKGTGAIYTRDDGGKIPIRDHRALLDLATAGEKAEAHARERPERNDRSRRLLGLTHRGLPRGYLRTVVRAAPLSVTPQLAEWPVTRGAGPCQEVASSLAGTAGCAPGYSVDVRPFGRAVFAAAAPIEPAPTPFYNGVAVADCVGVFGAAMLRGVVNVLAPPDLRRDHLGPVIDAVYALLHSAEAFGDAVFEVQLDVAREVYLPDEQGGYLKHRLPDHVHCGSAVWPVPGDDEDRANLGKRWAREVAREAGIPLWEPAPFSP